jgi:hypothetical protein
LPENLILLNTLGSENILDSNVKSLISDRIINACTLDEQIQGIRTLVSLVSSESEKNNKSENTESLKIAADILTFWFFKLPSNSCLKPVIASAINKLEETEGCLKQLFVSSFNDYVNNVICKALNYNADVCRGEDVPCKNVLSAESLFDFVCCVTRCFENNCKVAINTIKSNRINLVHTLESKFYTPVIKNMATQEKEGSIHDQKSIEIIATVIRSTLSLQSLYRVPLSNSFLEISINLLHSYISMSNPSQLIFDTETVSNLSLIMANEAKVRHPNNYIEFVTGKFDHTSRETTIVHDRDTSIYIVQIVNALAIASNLKDLFSTNEDATTSNKSVQSTSFERIYEMLERCCNKKMDPKFTVIHTMAVHNVVIRLQRFLNNQFDKKINSLSESIVAILLKIESYVWTFLEYNTDKVQHNVRNILNTLVNIYRDYSPKKKELHQLITKCLEMPWEQKTKYLALISIFKCPNSQVSTCMMAADDIAAMCPTISSILIEQLQYLHPSIENYCAELFEIFLTNDYVRHSPRNLDGDVDKNTNNKKQDLWFDTWFKPLINLKSVELDKISIPVLEKLINAGMKLSNIVFQRLVDNHQNYNLNNQTSDSNNCLKLVLIALKKQKLGNENSTFSNSIPSSVLGTILEKALFHFNDGIRIKGIKQKLHQHLYR